MSRTTDADQNDPLLRKARHRVAMKTGFYKHALIFALVNTGLFIFGTAVGGGHWSMFPMWGWALGLGIHGVATFLSLVGDGWRERMLAAELARLRSQQ